MFRLRSYTTIGKYSFRGGLNEVVIRKNVQTIMDTATLKMPSLSRILNDDSTVPQSSVETGMLFREGDPVTVILGYNKNLNTEFVGFVRRVNFGTPVTIDLEGYAWLLRKKNVVASWKKVKLRQVLEKVTNGTDIKLSNFIPDVNLTNLTINNQNGLQVLEWLKEKLLLTVYFNGPELYAGLEEGLPKPSVKYRLGWNVIKDDNLRYRLADDNLVRVRIVKKLKKGEQILFESGDKNGEVIKREVPNWQETDKLKKIADKVLQEKKFTGFEGKITAFLEPYCEPSYKAMIEDTRYPERSGSYFVASTEVKFGVRGARRLVELTRRLDG